MKSEPSGVALFVAAASGFNGFLVGMAISGLGFGVYVAVDLGLVADVLPNKEDSAKDLGVFNIVSAGPQSLAPAIAGACAVLSALAVIKVKGVR
jgi:MFS family permease